MEDKTKKKIIIGIILVWALFFGKGTYNRFVNSWPLTHEEVIGTYSFDNIDDIKFKSDGTITGIEFLHGTWEIYDTENQNVMISFYATQQDLAKFDEYMYYELEDEFYGGHTEDDIIEYYNQNHKMFKNKNFRYIRCEKSLHSIEDGDSVSIVDDEAGYIYENDFVFWKHEE